MPRYQNHMTVLNMPRTEEEALYFLQQQGLIHKGKKCFKGHSMAMQWVTQLGVRKPRWRCQQCPERPICGPRVDTFFADYKVSLLACVHFTYAWAHEKTSISWCAHELGWTEHTAVNWAYHMQQVCEMSLDAGQNERKRKSDQDGGSLRIFNA